MWGGKFTVWINSCWAIKEDIVTALTVRPGVGTKLILRAKPEGSTSNSLWL